MSMPRLEYNYDQSWPGLLTKHYPTINFIEKLRRSSSAKRLVNEGAGAGDKRRGADLLEYYNPNIVITQLGITDCSPRLLKRDRLSTKVINLLPRFISNPIYSFVRATKGRTINNNDLSPEEFKNCFENYIIRANEIGISILCILIAPATERFMSKSPLVEKSIEIYNDILLRLSLIYDNFTCLEPYTKSEMEKYSSSDGYHVNAEGQAFLFKKIAHYIDDYIEKNRE